MMMMPLLLMLLLLLLLQLLLPLNVIRHLRQRRQFVQSLAAGGDAHLTQRRVRVHAWGGVVVPISVGR
jgi:hypothetical protein